MKTLEIIITILVCSAIMFFGVSEDQINVWRNETPLSLEVVIPVGSETQFIEKSLYERVKTEISFKEEFAELLELLESEQNS